MSFFKIKRFKLYTINALCFQKTKIQAIATIMLVPAARSYLTPNTGLNQIRIAYVLKKEALIEAVQILKIALKKKQ